MNRMLIAMLAGMLGLTSACGDDDGSTDAGNTPDTGTDGDGGEVPDTGTDEDGGTEPPVDFLAASFMNRAPADPMLGAPTNLTDPDFVPADGSPAGEMAGTPGAGFDTTATYVGAIEPNGIDWTDGWTAYPAPGSGVTETAGGTCPALDARTEVMVGDDITSEANWTCDNIYVLTETVYVSAVLNIAAGTLIRGGESDALVITTAGQINAVGAADNPIVFTSNKTADRQPSDWGGVVMLGLAPINVAAGTESIEGLEPTEARGQYGGTDAAHNCGTLEYVRIEYAGFTFGDDNELNGLTLGGCGSDTTLDYVQVHLGSDDGIEFFGGTTNLTHAVVSQVGDDSLDWDEGWTGNVQFFIAQQGPAGNRTIEADNLEESEGATPRSAPTIWNATLIGNGQAEQQGARLRFGTAGEIHNTIFMNFTMEPCVRVQHSSVQQAIDGNLAVMNSILMGCGDMTPFQVAE